MDVSVKIAYVPHEKQLAVHRSTKRYKVCHVGRRGGKTTLALAELQKKWYEHVKSKGSPAKYWYIAPTLKQGRDIVWNHEMMFKFFPKELIKSRRDSDMFLELKDGSTIQVFGCQNYEDVGLLKGRGLDGAIVDEIDNQPRAVWYEALKFSLADKDGWCLFIGTADAGYGNLYELAVNAKVDDKWAVFNWSVFDNPHVSQKIKNEIQEDYDSGRISKVDWTVQVMGKFAMHAGAVYKEFDLDKHVYESMPDGIMQSAKFYLALDYGYSNPFVCLWAAIDQTNTIWIYREHYEREKNIGWHAKKIKELTGTEKIDGAFMDPSAKGMIEELKTYGYPLNRLANPFRSSESENASNRVTGGIEKLRVRLVDDNMLKRPTLFIHKSCINTIKEFQQYHWNEKDDRDTDAPVKEHDHAMDCLRYLEAGMSKPVTTYSDRMPRKRIVRNDPLE